MTVVIVLLAVAGVVYGALWWGAGSPALHRNLTRERLQGLLRLLLTQGTSSANLIIDVDGSDKFVQFQKYWNKQTSGIALAFPKAPWSQSYYDRVLAVITARHIPFSTAVGKPGEAATEFIMADLGDDIEAAQTLAYEVITDIFGADPQTACTARFHNVIHDSNQS